MATTKFFTLKEARLNNNCPECYSNDGLEITFKQKFKENAFYKAITTETSHEMHCNNCNTAIFPVRWTDDIERVVEYQQRAVQPKSKSIKLKPLAWVIIVLDILILALIVLVMTDVISF
ncbi:hypothetical protein [Winogradskyella ouciana]|uniref:Uncharacterized protein n=1 Tax=Winogradskyella ouciana TaxID=2608631 RepID=A0A7K1GAF9_9FLAO|nr:hypothetical protein [Winogradskyella ouciana]MTE26282.1 hypothetical protein [Winogradskyella ouciana]